MNEVFLHLGEGELPDELYKHCRCDGTMAALVVCTVNAVAHEHQLGQAVGYWLVGEKYICTLQKVKYKYYNMDYI